ncbi:TcdA/TcdB pore-forming domain-containing protein [Fluviispira multicolorata]|uniref:Peptidase C80 domain-containing protein n=1 Tax=Fluviispira multicolorata TaxID=2654512 RepID=A0A833N5N2_9BACT|nr:TcdA/TcdB pore-forming domain-containing protein [Fluviispira multicolorata]KAB8033579.1 hypothetical protein GCL57_02405 [Fluviispira multicolorata]
MRMNSKFYSFLLIPSFTFGCSNEKNKDRIKQNDFNHLILTTQTTKDEEIGTLIDTSYNEINAAEEILGKKEILDILEYYRKSIDKTLTNEEKYQLIMDIMLILPDEFEVDSSVYTSTYNKFANTLKDLYERTSEVVPKKIHFIWAGSELNEIQKDYIKLWAKLNSDYDVFVWYDSDAIYANRIKTKISDYVHAGLRKNRTHANIYEERYADKIINIQNDLSKFMEISINSSQNDIDYDVLKNDFIKSDLLIDLENKENILDNKKLYIEEIKKEFLKAEGKIVLKDIRNELDNWNMKKYYDQEINLRMNFAAASDIFRAKLENKYGGVYFDVDIFPSLASNIYFLDNDPQLLRSISKNRSLIKLVNLAFIESILNENIELKKFIKGRHFKSSENLDHLKDTLSTELNHYPDDISQKMLNLPQKILEAAVKSKSTPIIDLFNKLGDLRIRKGQFKTATEINNVIISHPSVNETDWINGVLHSIKNNYFILNYIHHGTSGKKAELSNHIATIDFDDMRFSNALLNYRYDGLLTNSKSTITISGPGVYNRFLENRYGILAITKNYFKSIKWFEHRNSIFNNNTEQDKFSSWLVKEDDNGKLKKKSVEKHYIMSIGEDDNIKKSAMMLFRGASNRKKENLYKFSLNENEVFKPTDTPFSANEESRLQIIANSSVEKIGERSFLKIGGFYPDALAERIAKQFTWGNSTDPSFEHISILSCDQNEENSFLMGTFVEALLNRLEELDISVRKLYLRTNLSRITEFGEKQYYDFKSGKVLYVDNGKNLFYSKGLNNSISFKKIPVIKESNTSEDVTTSQANFSFPEGEIEKLNENSLKIYLKYVGFSSEAFINTREFEKTIWRVMTHQNLSNGFVPLLHSIDARWKAIKFFHPISKENRLILLEPSDFKIVSDFKDYFEKNIKNMAIKVGQNKLTREQYLNEGLGGLNEGLAIKSIFDYLARKNSNNQDNKALSEILKAHACLNLFQLATGVLEDGNQMANMFIALNQVMSSEEHFASIFKGGVSLGTKASLLLSAANVVLDSLELSKATKASEKITYATQLGFDSIGLAMGSGSLFLAMLGEATTASAIGTFLIPFAGLAIGFTSFATAAADTHEKSIGAANYFLQYQRSHDLVGINSFNIPNNNIKVLSLTHKSIISEVNKENPSKYSLKGAASPAIIRTINLTSPNTLKFNFGTHHMYKTVRADEGWWFTGFGISPRPMFGNCNNYENITIPIRNYLDINAKVQLNLQENTIILLPITPEACISYEFGYSPGIINRHDAELVPIRKMQQKGEILFEYMVGLFEFSIRRLNFEYIKTNINVELGSHDQILLTPTIPYEWIDKIDYSIKGTAFTRKRGNILL